MRVISFTGLAERRRSSRRRLCVTLNGAMINAGGTTKRTSAEELYWWALSASVVNGLSALNSRRKPSHLLCCLMLLSPPFLFLFLILSTMRRLSSAFPYFPYLVLSGLYIDGKQQDSKWWQYHASEDLSTATDFYLLSPNSIESILYNTNSVMDLKYEVQLNCALKGILQRCVFLWQHK